MDTKFTKINLRCLGAEFAKYRKISGIRQEDAAKAVGKTRGWLSQVEIGALNISLKKKKRKKEKAGITQIA